MSAPRQNTDNRSRPQGQPPISEQGIPNTVNNGQMDKQKLYTKQAHIHTAPPLHIRNKHYSKKYHHFKTWRKYAFLLIPLSLTANKTIINSKVLKSTHCVLKSSKIFRIPCSSLRLTNWWTAKNIIPLTTCCIGYNFIDTKLSIVLIGW